MIQYKTDLNEEDDHVLLVMLTCNSFIDLRKMVTQGVKLTFIRGSHLAPKYFKVVANSKKLVAII